MILVGSSPSSLQAACFVLRFHGGVSATASSPPFLKVDNFGFPSHNRSSCSLPFQDHQYGGSAYRPSCEMLPTVPRKFRRNTDGNGSFLGISSEFLKSPTAL
ncbi:hypothetical protein Bca101_088660 [Brassica carinata]